MDATAVGGGPIHEPTVDLTTPISSTTPAAPATKPAAAATTATATVSRASFGWRPDEKPPTPPTRAGKHANAPKPVKVAKVKKPEKAPKNKAAKPEKAPKNKAPKVTAATPATAAAVGKRGAPEPTTSLKQPIGARGALLTILGAVLVIGGGVIFWIGHRQSSEDLSAASPAPITTPVASSAPPASAVAPTTPVSVVMPDTIAGQAAEFERSIGPSGLTDLANYRSALTALGDTIPLENGDPATYGTRLQNAAGDVVSASVAVVRALDNASVGPLVQPYVSDVRRTLDQVSAASKVVTACDPAKPCGPDILSARTTQQDAQLAATVLDGLTP